MESDESSLEPRIDESVQAPRGPMNKRAMETAILEMVYKTEELYSVIPSERPDFELIRYMRERAFGVEITQLFPNESFARLNLIPGYRQDLWSGGRHRDKTDVKVLETARISVTDKDGNVTAEDLPVVITKVHTSAEFREKLLSTIKEKSEKGYDSSKYSHINLIVLDWFHLQFDVSDYTTSHFFNDEIRKALGKSTFREIFLILNNSSQLDSEKKYSIPDARIIPMQQLLAMERLFVTGSAISELSHPDIQTTDDVNLLAIDNITRVQGYGDQVIREGKIYLRYRGTFATIGEKGLSVMQFRDGPFDEFSEITIKRSLPLELEKEIEEKVRYSSFGYPFAEKANRSIAF